MLITEGIVVAAIVLLLAVAVTVYLKGRRREPQLADFPKSDIEDATMRLARQNALEPLESELLERRMQLDGRRGPLGGDSELLDEFERLEKRFRAGEILEAEFEAEKIRLLSGD